MSVSLSFHVAALALFKNPLEIQTLVKSPNKVEVKVEPITNILKLEKANIPAWKLLGIDFEFNRFAKFLSQTRENHSALNLAIPVKSYMEKHYLKYISDSFLKIVRQKYHCPLSFKYQADTGHIVNRKYELSYGEYSLEVIIDYDEDYKLKYSLQLHFQDQVFDEGDFYLFDLFILIQNSFFVLSYQDYSVLEKLIKQDMTDYYFNLQAFNRDVLLEVEKRFIVHRNIPFPQEEIDEAPIKQILLSESGNLLLIQPQIRYQSILVVPDGKDKFECYDDGIKMIIHRRQDDESEFISRIQKAHPNFENQKKDTFFLSVDDAKKKNWFLKFYHTILDQDIEILGMDMLKHFRYSPHPIHTDFQLIEIREHIAYMKLIVKFGSERLSNKELKKSILAHQKTLFLEDNTIGVLPDEWLSKYGTLLRHSELDEDMLIAPQWLLIFNPELLAESTNANDRQSSEEWWKQWQQWQSEDTILIPKSARLHATLRPYQQKGFEWMVLLSKIGAGACLADDMGLGKTLQTICFLLYQQIQSPEKVHLIVCPSSLMYNWKNEIEKFCPDVSVKMYHGSMRSNILADKEIPEILITSYGTVRQDISKLEDLAWNTIVLDESHNIKNLQADLTKAALRLKGQGRVILSGTPILNSTRDLYPQMEFILPGYFGTASFFNNEYTLPIDRDKNVDRAETLKRMTAPFILRRTKEQVATDLPPKVESILYCTMGPAQRTYYDQVRSHIKSNILIDLQTQGLQSAKFNVLDGISKLRRLCSSPYLVEDIPDYCEDSIKVDMLINELTGSLSQQKVLVFSQFLNSLDLISNRLKEAHIPFYTIEGSTPQKKRQEYIDSFQETNDPTKVFLISLKAGNTGFTLTAANYVFLLDPWWNKQIENQAIDRAYRIGQDKNVFAYKMICRDTIEEKILQLQNRKQNLSNELITTDDGFVKNLNQEDIEFLFE